MELRDRETPLESRVDTNIRREAQFVAGPYELEVSFTIGPEGHSASPRCRAGATWSWASLGHGGGIDWCVSSGRAVSVGSNNRLENDVKKTDQGIEILVRR